MNFKKTVFIIIGGGILFFIGIYVFFAVWMGAEIMEITKQTQSRYEGDRITAFISALEDEQNGLDMKNRIIWTLGQYGDERAEPVCRSLLTGEECDHEKYVCQYELKKALAYMEGKPSVFAWIWNMQ